MQDNAAGDILLIIRVELGAGACAVRDAVEHASGIEQLAPGEIALRLDADIAVGDETRCESSLWKQQIPVALQQFVADRRLVLSDADSEGSREADVEIRILDNRCAAAEIGHYLELEIFADSSGECGTDLANGEGIRDRLRIVQRETAVGLGDQPKRQPVVAIIGLEGESVRPCRDDGGFLRLGREVLLKYFPSPVDNAHLLVGLFQCGPLRWNGPVQSLGRLDLRFQQSFQYL